MKQHGWTRPRPSLPPPLPLQAPLTPARPPLLSARLQGGANFTTTPEGYLVTPTAGGQSLICLSIFPW